ncbi:MAG: hypothetical protein CVV42_14125 [Candidatus Riflebacteria bacterium HGW-Riflebacteria-2]|nr:MAG: hypothetical protein CVV42_14125 [Candidatus Riflebacteria bacterium HGW-Riflebacteria-2]
MKIEIRIWILLLMVFAVLPSGAVELNDVYRQLGDYKIVATSGIRLYYPVSAEKAIPRVIDRFARVRINLLNSFPGQANFEATVILNDHDDRISSSSDAEFDWINLGLFEEIGVLSTRAYSLEKRFAMSLANIMILRTLAASSNSWRRKLAVIAVPQWFMDGLALKYAFPLDSIHFSRLLDMARQDRLYSLDQLSTILSQPTMIQEEMRFQAHSMFEFWSKKYGEDASLNVLKSIMRRPGEFNRKFREHYGVSLNDAYNAYRAYVCEKCNEFKEKAEAQVFEIEDREIGGHFFRSLRHLSPDERVWVSSRRYSTETYDLFYQKNGRKPVVLLKNVHPLLLVDEFSREIYLGRYTVNSDRQRSLGLYSVTPEGRSRCLVNAKGSFKPLGKQFGRIFYTSISSGITRVMSVDPEFKNSTRVEYTFPLAVHPLDLALSKSCRELFYTVETSDFKKRLVVVSIKDDDKEEKPIELYASAGDIGSLLFADDKIWFAGELDFYTRQLFSLDLDSFRLKKWTQLPGGVWDINFHNDQIELVTLNRGEFWKTSISQQETIYDTMQVARPVETDVPELNPVRGEKYRSEFHTSYWKPLLSEDEEGYVFGIYSYRTDRLGRSNIVIAPQYGIESKNWGYMGSLMQRFDQFKVTASIVDTVREKSYLDQDYFEGSRAKVVDIQYPLTLSTTVSVGMDLTERRIAKYPDPVTGPLPTIGKDHSFYGRINHRAIRTEPYYQVFPRRGRTVTAQYKRGNEVFGGEMNYDSMSLRWNEHFPVNRAWVLTARSFVAEDDKENNVRRPDDLSLGGTDFMRAFDSSYKDGDSLRAFALHLGRPIKLRLPRFMSWVYNEFMIAEAFWEMGDVKNQGRFKWRYDRGIELRSQLLLFKRIPIIVRVGYARQNGFDQDNTYIAVDSDVAGFL